LAIEKKRGQTEEEEKKLFQGIMLARMNCKRAFYYTGPGTELPSLHRACTERG